MTPADLLRLADDVLELDGSATPGPWGVLPSNNGNLAHVETQEGCIGIEQGFAVFSVPKKRIGDADFAAHTRTSAVSLARAVRAMVPLLKHGDECSIHGPGVRPCDCGLDSALASLGKDAHGR